MDKLENLNNNEFIKAVLKDGGEVLGHIKFKPNAIQLPEDVELNEYQYYIHNVGFYLVHTLTWCKQLDFAIVFLSNYDHSKK